MKNKTPLSLTLQAQLNRLARPGDGDVEPVDRPEAPTDAWRRESHRELYRPIKQPVTLRLDADVVAWFKEHARDRGYQTEINRVLRRHVIDAEARGG